MQQSQDIRISRFPYLEWLDRFIKNEWKEYVRTTAPQWLQQAQNWNLTAIAHETPVVLGQQKYQIGILERPRGLDVGVRGWLQVPSAGARSSTEYMLFGIIHITNNQTKERFWHWDSKTTASARSFCKSPQRLKLPILCHLRGVSNASNSLACAKNMENFARAVIAEIGYAAFFPPFLSTCLSFKLFSEKPRFVSLWY